MTHKKPVTLLTVRQKPEPFPAELHNMDGTKPKFSRQQSQWHINEYAKPCPEHRRRFEDRPTLRNAGEREPFERTVGGGVLPATALLGIAGRNHPSARA